MEAPEREAKFYIKFVPGAVEGAAGSLREYFESHGGSKGARAGMVEARTALDFPRQYAAFKEAYNANKVAYEAEARANPNQPIFINAAQAIEAAVKEIRDEETAN